jgi:hypothetical protein
LEAALEAEYARDSIGFHWAGCEEGDEDFTVLTRRCFSDISSYVTGLRTFRE